RSARAGRDLIRFMASSPRARRSPSQRARRDRARILRRPVAERSRRLPRHSPRNGEDTDTRRSQSPCRSPGRRARMTTRPPDFDDLVGGEVPGEERARLRRVHELLVQADQPPELSPELDAVPWPNEALTPLSSRRRGRERRRSWLGLAAAAAAIALIAFIIGEGRGGQS